MSSNLMTLCLQKKADGIVRNKFCVAELGVVVNLQGVFVQI